MVMSRNTSAAPQLADMMTRPCVWYDDSKLGGHQLCQRDADLGKDAVL